MEDLLFKSPCVSVKWWEHWSWCASSGQSDYIWFHLQEPGNRSHRRFGLNCCRLVDSSSSGKTRKQPLTVQTSAEYLLLTNSLITPRNKKLIKKIRVKYLNTSGLILTQSFLDSYLPSVHFWLLVSLVQSHKQITDDICGLICTNALERDSRWFQSWTHAAALGFMDPKSTGWIDFT